jgi:hypothetical protein
MKFNIFKKKKYFLVSYVFNNGSGCMTMFCENMDFLNSEKTIEIIKESDSRIKEVTISSIMRLSKKEYECWGNNLEDLKNEN